jgi:hypothetical protein
VTDILYDAAAQLHACLCAQVNALTNPPERCCLSVGAQFELGVALNEDMCRCGTAWVRIAGFVPSVTFPGQQEEPTNCRPPFWALTLEMGIARCPPLGTMADLPTCTEWATFAQTVMDDAAAMRRALYCCEETLLKARGLKFVVGNWTPFGPEGMCGGGTMTVTVPVLACDECP